MKIINKKELLFFIILLILISSQILPKEVNNLDEMWNFNFANCMANGLVPYKDFNIIPGPLLPIICSIFLKIFGQEMIVMRILAIILDAIILFMTYKIMQNLKIQKYLKYTAIIILVTCMKNYFTIDYNWATLLMLLIIINLEIKKENNKKKELLIGILAGCAIAFKQTIGIIIAVGTIIYPILEIQKKEEIKQYIKNVIYRFIGILIAALPILIYLIINGALNYYIDYCILGIATFSNKISYIERLIKSKNILIKILSVMPSINIILLYMYVKKREKQILALLIYSLINLIFVYPISDEAHFVIAIVPTIIGFTYIINLLIPKAKIPIKIELIIQYFLESFLATTSIVIFIYAMISYSSKNINMELNHFKYLPMNKESIENVQKIGNYIKNQEKQVLILDAVAAYYTIPINQYNKNYDMFLKGNLGSKGEEGQIENLKNLQNKQILIMNEKYNRNWQNPEKVREYIQTQMTKIGEIGIFDIYE